MALAGCRLSPDHALAITASSHNYRKHKWVSCHYNYCKFTIYPLPEALNTFRERATSNVWRQPAASAACHPQQEIIIPHHMCTPNHNSSCKAQLGPFRGPTH